MRLPNLFIVGAPKCGTTALHAYLGQHPQIFMSDIKEPQHYCTDFGFNEFTRDDYLRLFRGATPEHRYLGESSVYYLYSEVAIQNLLAEQPNARLIVMLRNPIELVHSLHAQHLAELSETIEDFAEAWAMQPLRARGEAIPPLCLEPRMLLYRDVARLGEQLRRAMQLASPEQMHVILFDDFKSDTKAAFARVLDFLELPPAENIEFSTINPNTRLRSKWIRTLLDRQRIPVALRRWGRTIRLHKLYEQLIAWNQVPAQRTPLDASLKQELIETFRDDVGLLSDLTHRDLSHWLAT
jgi:hypothetical protein